MYRTARLATVVGVSALAAFALAGPASAHVTVSSAEAKQGGYAVVTFRMPNEEDKASTTKLEVQLPTNTPLAYVGVQPVTGWTAVVTKSTLKTPIKTEDGEVTQAASSVTWVATSAAALKPGEFGQFNVQMGPLPKSSSMVFPAIQTYSNGDVVRWVERQAPGSSAEPEHPAPVLNLTSATTTASSGDNASASAQPAAAPSTSSDSSSNTGPIVLSIIALVLAAGALGLAVVNRARRSS